MLLSQVVTLEAVENKAREEPHGEKEELCQTCLKPVDSNLIGSPFSNSSSFWHSAVNILRSLAHVLYNDMILNFFETNKNCCFPIKWIIVKFLEIPLYLLACYLMYGNVLVYCKARNGICKSKYKFGDHKWFNRASKSLVQLLPWIAQGATPSANSGINISTLYGEGHGAVNSSN